MGLDVYLYQYKDRKRTEELEAKYETVSSENWGERKYDEIPENEKEAIRAKNKEFALSLGLDEGGDDKVNKICIEQPSKLHPDHYFKMGYFRSSYSSSGINRVLSDLGLETLDWIFEAGDDYIFQPDWNASLTRCNELLGQLKLKPNLRVGKAHANIFEKPNITTPEQALTVYLEATAKEAPFEGGWSNKVGEFYPKEPLKVHGIIHGTYKILQEQPCVYLILEGENEWYIQALEIVKETIEWVLAQSNMDEFYLHWSS